MKIILLILTFLLIIFVSGCGFQPSCDCGGDWEYDCLAMCDSNGENFKLVDKYNSSKGIPIPGESCILYLKSGDLVKYNYVDDETIVLVDNISILGSYNLFDDGRILLYRDRDGKIITYNLESENLRNYEVPSLNQYAKLIYSGENRSIYYCWKSYNDESGISRIDTETGKLEAIVSFEPSKGNLRNFELTKNSTYLLLRFYKAYDDNDVFAYEIQTGSMIEIASGVEISYGGFSISNRSGTIAFVMDDYLYLMDENNLEPIKTEFEFTGYYDMAEISPLGDYLIKYNYQDHSSYNRIEKIDLLNGTVTDLAGGGNVRITDDNKIIFNTTQSDH